MPRIRQLSGEYVKQDFQAEIRRRQGEFNIMSVRSLAKATEIPNSSLALKLKNPDAFTVGELRRIVRTISPDPATVLALLGYTKKEIRSYE